MVSPDSSLEEAFESPPQLGYLLPFLKKRAPVDDEKLNEKQEMAIELALTGISDGEIARRVKVSRQWVNTWRNHNTDFIDALGERRRMLREKHQDSINGLVEKAIEVMRNALDDGDPKIRLQAAKLVLSTAALKDSIKREQEPSEGDAILKELGEAMGMVGKKLGYSEPGKNNSFISKPIFQEPSGLNLSSIKEAEK